MKKPYAKPEAKKVHFQYTEVVVASGSACTPVLEPSTATCGPGHPHYNLD